MTISHTCARLFFGNLFYRSFSDVTGNCVKLSVCGSLSQHAWSTASNVFKPHHQTVATVQLHSV